MTTVSWWAEHLVTTRDGHAQLRLLRVTGTQFMSWLSLIGSLFIFAQPFCKRINAQKARRVKKGAGRSLHRDTCAQCPTFEKRVMRNYIALCGELKPFTKSRNAKSRCTRSRYAGTPCTQYLLNFTFVINVFEQKVCVWITVHCYTK